MFNEPAYACDLCPRLKAFRDANISAHPDWYNGPVPAFGDLGARLLIVGLAPGLKGANLTGRPFTGDYAGDLLYATLHRHGFAEGAYAKHKKDGLKLLDCRITNAVRCVPPENKPVGAETSTCNDFLKAEIAAMPNLLAILALGTLSHGAVLSALGMKKSAFKFAHAARHTTDNGLSLFNSYHCSRYNTNTGRLNEQMFSDVFVKIRAFLDD
ncbi:uracil-DNA glycosylase [Thalassospiraceae bacterium LMO-JJ14]|nr:uracil-DNA glycosylase [Thalassospiraceae bacterium LMO-JJ14]